MLIAVDDVNKRLILGLHQENIERLLNDMPIEKHLGQERNMPEPLNEWTVYILGPEDLARFVARFQKEAGNA